MVWTTDSTKAGMRLLSLEVRMTDSESDQKRDLECLRLASDLIELASMSLTPELKAQCLRMATELTEQANQGHGRM